MERPCLFNCFVDQTLTRVCVATFWLIYVSVKNVFGNKNIQSAKKVVSQYITGLLDVKVLLAALHEYIMHIARLKAAALHFERTSFSLSFLNVLDRILKSFHLFVFMKKYVFLYQLFILNLSTHILNVNKKFSADDVRCFVIVSKTEFC